jgi:hypothetical protein
MITAVTKYHEGDIAHGLAQSSLPDHLKRLSGRIAG